MNGSFFYLRKLHFKGEGHDFKNFGPFRCQADQLMLNKNGAILHFLVI